MSIMADRWIKENCSGPRFQYINTPITLVSDPTIGELLPFRLLSEEEVVHKSIPASFLRFPELIEQANALKVGEFFKPDEHTKILKITDGEMITPFFESSNNKIQYRDKEIKVPSYGLSSYGYDIRLGRNFKVMDGRTRPGINIIDPALNNHDEFYTDVNDVDSLVLQPGCFALGVSMERISMPDNVTAVCMAKSSLARMALSLSVTPIEASWSGFITLEIHNLSPHPVLLYAGMGAMQLIFHEGEERPMVTYADRGGKYQDQPAVPVASRM